MNAQWIIITVVGIYLVGTTLIGFLQSKKIKNARELSISKLSSFQAATFLAGFTLGGASTYGVAGDTIKFGLTYLFWFPFSVALGWWVTGLLFAGPYYRMQGITLPALLGDRFDQRTRFASMLSNMIYTIFVIVIEIYTLSMIIRAIVPSMTMLQAAIIALVTSVGTVAFSGIMGASLTNVIHTITMLLAFGLVFVTMWMVVGGWEPAFKEMAVILPNINNDNVDIASWLSPVGLGWGAVGQILLAKSGRLGGISAVSNLAASCRSEKDAKKAFLLAGFISAIPPFLACSVGIFTAAYLGERVLDMPIYSAIGFAIADFNPILAGIFLAAVAAAILSTFSPLAVSFSSVFVEDIVKRIVKIPEENERILYPVSLIVVSIACTVYVVIAGIEHIMPFVFSTAFPCTIPNTLVALVGIRSKRTSSQAAFWAIILGVSISLLWGLVLDDPFGIPNIVIALIIPLLILGVDFLVSIYRPKRVASATREI